MVVSIPKRLILNAVTQDALIIVRAVTAIIQIIVNLLIVKVDVVIIQIAIKEDAIGVTEAMERQMIIAEMADEVNILMEVIVTIRIIANLPIAKVDAAIIPIQVTLITQILQQPLGLIPIVLQPLLLKPQ